MQKNGAGTPSLSKKHYLSGCQDKTPSYFAQLTKTPPNIIFAHGDRSKKVLIFYLDRKDKGVVISYPIISFCALTLRAPLDANFHKGVQTRYSKTCETLGAHFLAWNLRSFFPRECPVSMEEIFHYFKGEQIERHRGSETSERQPVENKTLMARKFTKLGKKTSRKSAQNH